MENFKGTKGKWEIEKGWNNAEVHIMNNDRTIIVCRGINGSLPLQETNANAKIVAAAPKMLEALQNLENDNGQIPEHAWKMVKDAVSCALGNER